jgi:type I restriction enzyme S subunit
MSVWSTVTLTQIAFVNPTEKLTKGKFVTKISMDNLRPYSKKIYSQSQEAYNGGMKFRNGDTLVARITPCLENGKTAFVDTLDSNEVGFGSTEYIVLRAKKDLSDSHFLYYFARSETFREVAIASMTGSSGRQRVQTDVVENYEFDLPSLPEQKAIAFVLKSFDDKIDLLHRQNKTLEAMAETLFHHWFMEDESLEQITVNDLIEFNPKRTLRKGTEATYLEMAGLSTQSFNATGYYTREFTSGTKFINQDTLLARITPCLENGKAGYVTFLSDNEVGWGSTEYIVMRPKSGIHPLMAYVLCRNQDFKDYAESCMEGSSGRQRVNVDHLKEFTIGKPSDEVIQQFNDYLESIESKLIYNSKQIQTLENLRNTLLPKLMSGEVRVQYQTEDVA